MAEKSDGSLKIDTKMDNTGFKKGSEELKQAVRSLTNQVDATGKQLQNAFQFDFGQPKQAANTFTNALKQMNGDIQGLGDLGKKAIAGDVEALDRFKAESDEVLTKLEGMKAELQKFGASEFETPEHAKAAEQYDAAAAKVTELKLALDQAIEAEIALEREFTDSDAYARAAHNLEVAKATLEEYKRAVASGNTGKVAQMYADNGWGGNKSATGPEDAVRRAQEAFDKLEASYMNSKGVVAAGKNVEKLEQQLEQATTEAERLKAQLDSTPGTFEGYESTEYAKDRAALESTIDKVLEYRRLVREGMSGDPTATSAIDKVQEKTKSAGKAGSEFAKRMKHAFSVVISGAKSAAASLAGMVRSGITGGLKRLGGLISSLGKRSKKSNNSLSGSFKTMLKYGLGIRSLFVLFNKLRAALKEGFGNLSQYDSALATNISNFKNALASLKNSFAAAFAPIAEIVLPILTRLINGLADAISKIGQLIAALTGKSTYIKAQTGAASSASSAAGAMDKEAASAKKLQKTLAGFDDVQILQDNSQDSSGSSGAGGAGSGFEEVPIDNNFGDLAQMLKDAWAKADFYEIGQMIGNKLRDALESIPWAGIKATLSKIAKSIATFLNGFLEAPGLFTVIGQTVAQGLNSAFTFVETFVSNFHWASLGKAIKDGIMGFLGTIDWPLIYRTMAGLGAGIGTALQNAVNDPKLWSDLFTTLNNSIKALCYGAITFLSSVEWEDLGSNIGDGLKEGMATIPWNEIFALAENFGTDLADFLNGLFKEDTFEKVGETAEQMITAAFKFLNSFGENFNFAGFGKSLAAGINGFLNKFSPMRLASGIITLVNGFKDTVVSFLSETHWYDFGAKLVQIFKAIPWETLFSSAGEVIWEAINSAILAAKGFFSELGFSQPFLDALDSLQKTLKKISDEVDFESLAKGFKDLVNALKPAVEGFAIGLINVLNGLVNIGIEFLEKLGPAFQAIADAINSLPAGTVEKFGEDLGKVAGAFVIMKGAQSVITTLGGLATKLGQFATAGSTAAAGGQAAAQGVSAAGEAATAAAGGVGGFFSSLSTNIGATALFGDMIDKHVIRYLDGSADAAEEFDTAANLVLNALIATEEQSGSLGVSLSTLQTPMSRFAFEDAPDFANAFGQVATKLETAGGDVDTFKLQLKSMLDQGLFSESQAKVIADYIGDIGSSADTSSGKTSDLQGVFGAFDSVSWLTVVKLGLMSGAIQALGEKGELTDEQAAGLQKTLDAYNANPTEENMGRVQTAFEQTGISAEQFASALSTAYIRADTDTKKQLGNVIKTIGDFAPDAKAKGTDIGTSLADGNIEGMKSKEASVNTGGKDLVLAGYTGMKKAGEINSPSKATMRLGQFLGEGLFIGLEQQKAKLTTLATTIITAVQTAIETFKTPFQNAGAALGQSLVTGLSSSTANMSADVATMAENMRSSFTQVSWWDAGKNIAVGIYNGLFAHSSWLSVLAWNTAVNMYNSACRALGIHSPSKEFAYIGEMITKGLGEGVEDTQSNATKAVSAMADAVTQEAENADPSVKITAAVSSFTDGFSTVLNGFSDKVVQSFDGMIAAMESIVNGSSFTVPAVAAGATIPYSANRYSQESEDKLVDAVNALAAGASSRLTRNDLTEVLASVLGQYLNIDFYIGDEQIARHANAGNLRIEQRYNPTR